MQVARRVVAKLLHIDGLEDIEGLQQCGALLPLRELEHVDALVVRRERLLDLDLPLREIVGRKESAILFESADEILRDVALVEPVVRGLNRIRARLAGLEGRGFRLNEFAQGRRKIRLLENLAGSRCFAGLTLVGQEDAR